MSLRGHLIGGWRAEEFAKIHSPVTPSPTSEGSQPFPASSSMPGMPWSYASSSTYPSAQKRELDPNEAPNKYETPIKTPIKSFASRMNQEDADWENAEEMDKQTEEEMQERIEIKARLRAKMLDQRRRDLAKDAAGPCQADQQAAYLLPDGSVWERHELAWRFFEKETPESIGFDDIPWPPNPAIIAGMIEVLNAKDDASIKTAYRVLTLRWHPDKFMSRWGRHVEDQEQRDRIRAAVNRITQTVRAQYQALKRS